MEAGLCQILLPHLIHHYPEHSLPHHPTVNQQVTNKVLLENKYKIEIRKIVFPQNNDVRGIILGDSDR